MPAVTTCMRAANQQTSVACAGRRDKVAAGLKEAEQKAWDAEANRFEKTLMGSQPSPTSMMGILNSLVGAGEAVSQMAAEVVHMAADEVANAVNVQTQPPTPGGVARQRRRSADRPRRQSLLGSRKR